MSNLEQALTQIHRTSMENTLSQLTHENEQLRLDNQFLQDRLNALDIEAQAHRGIAREMENQLDAAVWRAERAARVILRQYDEIERLRRQLKEAA